MTNEWEVLEETFGMPQAELLRSYLESQGIPVFLSQEGAGHALGLTVGTLGTVEVLVPSQMLESARRIMAGLDPEAVSRPSDEPSSSNEQSSPDEQPDGPVEPPDPAAPRP